jgi:hypothetical protein
MIEKNEKIDFEVHDPEILAHARALLAHARALLDAIH